MLSFTCVHSTFSKLYAPFVLRAQCSSKIAEVNEQCEERLRKVGVKDGNAMKEDLVITEAEKQKVGSLVGILCH